MVGIDFTCYNRYIKNTENKENKKSQNSRSSYASHHVPMYLKGTVLRATRELNSYNACDCGASVKFFNSVGLRGPGDDGSVGLRGRGDDGSV